MTRNEIAPFLSDDFLLETPVSRHLYHEYAEKQPIIDYHNHLPPDQIAGNVNFENITQVWLYGDHYKWRAMRTLGIDERYITGDASDEEKFLKWAETVPYTMRNPLYHWTHLELKRYFGVTDLLHSSTAKQIYDECSAKLRAGDYSARNLLLHMNVELVCTTDDPVDNLEHHIKMAKENGSPKMLPAFRPDKAILIEASTFKNYIKKLGEAADQEIRSFDSLLSALKTRINFFHNNGCRLADHGLEQIYATEYTASEVDSILKKKLKGEKVTREEAVKYMSAVLIELGRMYSENGWVQQFHLGALRNTNDRMIDTLGPDTGYDSIGDFSQARSLAAFLNKLDSTDQLAKTILYNLNPADNEVFATMIGNFNDGSVKGKIQWGSAWWFLDQKDGMEKQMNTLSNMGLLSCFIGMLTDSRSFLSFPRHEYFRRILCNLIGRDVHNGELPNDIEWLGSIVEDICYGNAKRYFNF